MDIWQFIIIIVLIIIAMLNPKISLKKIFKAQFNVYKNDITNKIYWFDIVTFLLIPIAIGIISSFYIPVFVVSRYGDTVLTIFSLIATLLLSFVAILVDKKFEKQKQKEVVSETIASITTSIIYSVFVVALVVLPKIVIVSESFKKVILGTIVFFIVKIVFSMLMILKRVFIIVDIDNSKKK